MPPRPEQMLSHYRLLEKIGEGGMGVVYVAWDTTLKRKVALKVLPVALATDPVRLERLQREAEAVAALNHPSIVTIHSVEDSAGTRFLTMELVEGESLDQVAAAGPLPVPRVLEIGIALADALSAAHERGIIHRDLKPANVMLARDGRVKVLDFGLAKLADAVTGDLSQMATRQAPLTHDGGVVGTAPYMSPEQLRAETVDHRTDIFSLGVVLYELATGRRPFAGKNAAEIVSSILRDTPVPLTQIREEVPRHLGRIITHCLEKGLRERFQTARDVCNDLERLRDETRLEAQAGTALVRERPPEEPASAGPVAAPPASLPTAGPGRVRTTRPVMRNPWILLAGAGVLIAGTAVVWLAWSERGSKPGAGAEKPADASQAVSRTKVASIAVLPFVNMSGDAENEYFSDGLAEELLNALAKNPALRVSARTSSFSFKGKDTEIAEIGRRLNVATVLEGSVRKAGNRVRITTQLINVADGYHLWSETYDRQLEDIFAVQDDIARSVMSSLKATLLDAGAGAGEQRTGNIEAYNLVLKAEYFWKRFGPWDVEKAEKARDLVKQALALDPDYARAWMYLGVGYAFMVERGELSREEGLRLSRDATERALALDDSLAEAHAGLGWSKMAYDYDWAGAEADLTRALALEPQNAGVLNLAAALAAVRGRLTEANEFYRQIHEIDPLSCPLYLNYAITLWQEGRQDEALAAARGVLELDPQWRGAHLMVGQVYLAQEKPDQALQEILQETLEDSRLYGLVMAYHALGRKAESDAALATYTEKYQGIRAYNIASLHAIRGELDEAFEWLDRAYARREALFGVKVDPELANLRSDPRWLPFLRKMRLAD